MFGFTYNLTDDNTITITKATENTSAEWTFTNLVEVSRKFQEQGYTVIYKN